MAKIIRNSLVNFLVILVIFSLMTGWFFSGWPRIWQNPSIPPEIQVARAVCESSPCSYTTAGPDTFTVPAYDTLTVTVWGGGGGGGGAGTAGVTSGGDGGQSSFGSPTPVVANGGTGGTGDSAGSGAAGGGGGTASGGDTNTTGGTGGTTLSGNTTGGAGGDAPNGGTGGGGGSKSVGSAGNVPGGGGGGGGYQSGGTKRAGGGGGSGGYSTKTFFAGELTESSSINVVVGAVGTAGSASTGNGGGAGARGQIDISWTEAATYCITRTDAEGTIEYGNEDLGQSTSTEPTTGSNQIVIVQNCGNQAKFNIKTSYSTNWTAISGDPSGQTDQFRHSFATTSPVINWQVMGIDPSYAVASSTVDANASLNVYLKIEMPGTDSSNYAQQSITVTVQAAAP